MKRETQIHNILHIIQATLYLLFRQKSKEDNQMTQSSKQIAQDTENIKPDCTHDNTPDSVETRGNAILIVGDWVIDEYWFLFEHQSDKSTHNGQSHYRISADVDDVVSDLCAAGHTARVLYKILHLDKDENHSEYTICGLGHWNKEDTNNILHMFHIDRTQAKCHPVIPPFRLNTTLCQTPPIEVCLKTMNDDSSTIRVVRQYHQRGIDLVQINRVDWEPEQAVPVGVEAQVAASEKRKNVVAAISSDFKNKFKIKDIVVYDSGKGAVDEYLISNLKEKFPDAKWYILSKASKPEWLKSIKNLELLIIRPELAAIIKPWDTWLINGRISDRATNLISEYEAKHVVLLSEQREVVARLNNNKNCVTAKSTTPANMLHQLGWSSAFMASLVSSIVSRHDLAYTLKKDDIKKSIEDADKYSHVILPREQDKTYKPGDSQITIKRSIWKNEICEWAQAHKKYGILGDSGINESKSNSPCSQKSNINPPAGSGDSPAGSGNPPANSGTPPANSGNPPAGSGSPPTDSSIPAIKAVTQLVSDDSETDFPPKTDTLDLWRGATELPGYIAIIKQKRDAIVEIGERLRAFKNQSSPTRSLSITIQGDPGSGKTFLARSLAKNFGFSFVTCNITQMIRKEELFDLFETVATRQASGSEALLVFVDEINAQIENSNVYGAFLSPLEDGVYVRNGKPFSLKPCVWIFAGTFPNSVSSDQKYSDFQSRITLMEYIDYNSMSTGLEGIQKVTLVNQARVEQVYLGATAIRNYFPDVKQASRDTLKYFHSLSPESNPSRSIMKFVSSFKNVQYGKITKANWADGSDPKYADYNDPTMVNLNFQA
jgi:hypothetical protein